MNTLASEIEALEKSIRDGGANLDAVLADAGVARSTWTRWKNGSVTGARYDTMARVRQAAAEATAERKTDPAPSTGAQA